MFEKWHKTGKYKEINFKVYFFEGKPESSGLAFWNYNLNTVLKLAKPHVKTFEVFFNDDFDCGALIINGFCVLRFSFDGNTHPKIRTLETDKRHDGMDQTSTIATNWVRMQFLEVKSPKHFPNKENVERIFKILEQNRLN